MYGTQTAQSDRRNRISELLEERGRTSLRLLTGWAWRVLDSSSALFASLHECATGCEHAKNEKEQHDATHMHLNVCAGHTAGCQHCEKDAVGSERPAASEGARAVHEAPPKTADLQHTAACLTGKERPHSAQEMILPDSLMAPAATRRTSNVRARCFAMHQPRLHAQSLRRVQCSGSARRYLHVLLTPAQASLD